MQVQQWQHLADLRGLAGPRRQDRRREPLALTGVGVGALVVHPGRLHRDRTSGGDHLAFGVVAVADHQAVPVFVDLTRVPGDIVGDLGLQRSGQHLPGTITHDLVEQRPPGTDRGAGRVGVIDVVHYREHGRAFPPARQRWS